MIRQTKARVVVVTSVLFFLSGSAALVYEILWMKELSLLFGNSAQAAAATLVAFFAGIAAGNAYWGRRASKLARPLLVYGVLEICVTLSAVIYFAIYLAYDSAYPILFDVFEYAPRIFTFAKFVLALLLFFPAAFFMGGTLPVMTQYLVRNPDTLGKHATTLYAINTFGAACGAIAAGFFLPHVLGTNASYCLAMVVTSLVGLSAMVLGRKTSVRHNELSSDEPSRAVGEGNLVSPTSSLKALALLSGFASLALQVLWVRMFAQVLHNSVYTYSAILAVFLIALATGGAIARKLAQRRVVASWLVPSLLSLTALLIAASPIAFHFLTDGASYIGGGENFISYLLQVFSIVAIVIGMPTMAIGILLPYLFKLSENGHTGPGQTVGSLVTINTVGAIFGSLVAGFFLLEWLGLWSSLSAIAALYIVASLWLLVTRPTPAITVKLLPVIALLLITVFNINKPPLVKIDAIGKKEILLKVWEGSDATVAVVQRDGHLRTKMNNWYTLGGTDDMSTQQMQTHLPLQLHPNAKKVFYLGLGTGITAGTSLNYPVEQVVISELSPSAIKASKEFFGNHTNGLYNDQRVSIIAEDGRNVLRGSRSAYDLIISDLFIPWKAGTGSLYSVQHYEAARDRLNADGMYIQWLPLYQLTKDEFAIIARSMQHVFPTVSMWRGNFSGKRPVIALVGHKRSSGLSSDLPLLMTSRLALREQLKGQGDRVPLIAHYAGTLRSDDLRISAAPLNTDNHPIIEYSAPINHRLEKAGRAEWLVGQQLLDFINPYLNEATLSADPYLSRINPLWHDAIQAGYYLQAFYVLKDDKNKEAPKIRASFESLLKQAAGSMEQNE